MGEDSLGSCVEKQRNVMEYHSIDANLWNYTTDTEYACRDKHVCVVIKHISPFGKLDSRESAWLGERYGRK